MKDLPDFLAHFAATRTDNDAERLLGHYLGFLNESDQANVVSLLMGRTCLPKVTAQSLQKALLTRIPAALLEASKPEATDLSEALSLLWPGGNKSFNLTALDDLKDTRTREERERTAFALLDAWDAKARDLLIRLLTGRFRSPAKPSVIRSALARTRNEPLWKIEEAWAPDGFLSPGPLSHVERHQSADHFIPLPAGDLLIAIQRPEGGQLCSLQGDLISDPAPPLPHGTWLIHRRTGQILDVLYQDQSDLRHLPWTIRKTTATSCIANEDLAPSLPWTRKAIDDHFHSGPGNQALLIHEHKPLVENGEARGLTIAAAPPPSLTFCLLYTEGPLPRKGPFKGEVTLGVWQVSAQGQNETELVPVGKASLARLSDKDCQLVADFAHDNTLERFGPVRKLPATAEDGLVLEATVRRIEKAPRRKAGLLVQDVVPLQVCTIDKSGPLATLADLTKLALL